MIAPLPDLAGKTAVVTGATGGIGLWTAFGLARAGAEVVIVGRSPERLEAAASWIASQGRRRRPQVEQADFASLREVRDLAGRLAMRLDRLEILVNNAGLISPQRRLSADGYELTFAVNHLAPFLLTSRLLPSLRAAAAGRVVTVASTAHQRARLNWDDPMGERRYGAMTAYSQSKLANILFTAELARRLVATRVTANCLHPGVVATGFGAVGGAWGLLWRLASPLLMSAEQGAATSIYVAASPELAGVSGKYFSRSRAVSPSGAARNKADAARLWKASEAWVDGALA